MKGAVFAAALVLGCGGQTVGDDGGTDAASDGEGWDGLVTPCSAGAAMLCGANCGNSCPHQANGSGCTAPGEDDGGHLALCDTIDGGIVGYDCNECIDGYVCAALDGYFSSPPTAFAMVCADPRYAEMYALNGHPELARYSDRSAYTGTPLPTPGDCPNVPGVKLCGGACGACPSGYVCVGRSPLHPYSLCVNDWRVKPPPNSAPKYCIADAGPGSCFDGNDTFRCFTFKVDDASQDVANLNSLCIDKSTCLAAAAGYPGGAFCAGP